MVKPLKIRFSITHLIKKITFLEDPFFPGIQVPYAVGHKSQMIVVEEMRESDERPEEPQHKEAVCGTFFRVEVLEKAVEEKAFQIVSYTLDPGRKH